MTFDKLVQNLSDIIKIAAKSSQPTDLILSQLLRQRKYIGSKERQFISESLFAYFRNQSLIEWSKTQIFSEIDQSFEDEYHLQIIALLLLTLESDFGIDYCSSHLLSKIYPNKESILDQLILPYIIANRLINDDSITEWIGKSQSVISNIRKMYSEKQSTSPSFNTLYSIPEWITDDLVTQGISPVDFACSVNKPANPCIRITDNSYTESIVKLLNSKDIPFHFSKLVPNCIILEKRAKIDDSDEYRQGMFEVQDEGSQLIAYVLNASKNSDVLDACAGAGGKSLHISDLCDDNCDLVAADIDYPRINEFRKRLYKYHKDNITVMHIKSMDHKSLEKNFANSRFDFMLIDAPCTGLGTIRRDPLKKFRINVKQVDKMHQKQLEIIEHYAKYLKLNGVLVYATCSVHSTENQNTINSFLKNNPDYAPDSISDVLDLHNIKVDGLKDGDFCLNLYPNVHGTDGFFMARIKRIK